MGSSPFDDTDRLIRFLVPRARANVTSPRTTSAPKFVPSKNSLSLQVPRNEHLANEGWMELWAFSIRYGGWFWIAWLSPSTISQYMIGLNRGAVLPQLMPEVVLQLLTL